MNAVQAFGALVLGFGSFFAFARIVIPMIDHSRPRTEADHAWFYVYANRFYQTLVLGSCLLWAAFGAWSWIDSQRGPALGFFAAAAICFVFAYNSLCVRWRWNFDGIEISHIGRQPRIYAWRDVERGRFTAGLEILSFKTKNGGGGVVFAEQHWGVRALFEHMREKLGERFRAIGEPS